MAARPGARPARTSEPRSALALAHRQEVVGRREVADRQVVADRRQVASWCVAACSDASLAAPCPAAVDHPAPCRPAAPSCRPAAPSCRPAAPCRPVAPSCRPAAPQVALQVAPSSPASAVHLPEDALAPPLAELLLVHQAAASCLAAPRPLAADRAVVHPVAERPLVPYQAARQAAPCVERQVAASHPALPSQASVAAHPSEPYPAALAEHPRAWACQAVAACPQRVAACHCQAAPSAASQAAAWA